MAKFAPAAMLDTPLDYLDQANMQVMCSAQPTTYAEATSTYALGDVAMVPDTDYTKANGDVSGRKVTTAAKNGVLVDVSGTVTHLALVRTDDSTLRYVTTTTSQALTAGNTANIPGWKVEIAGPS